MDILSAFPLLDPQGAVALAERGLIFNAVLLMLIVVVPVLALAFFFAWHYRAGNKKAHYLPNWEHSKMEELVWWAIPLEIVLILGALTWGSTHQLDPRKPLEGGAPLVVQVVALDWKWLFIYPEQGVASVNRVEMPVGRPVRFEVTAEGPMNSFWIPQLGGQIYAMTGMVKPLNLVADRAGTYDGLSANYSGAGFAQMKFLAVAVPQEEFETWVQEIKQSSSTLDHDVYRKLAAPSVEQQVVYYGAVEHNLYSDIVMSFGHGGSGTADHH